MPFLPQGTGRQHDSLLVMLTLISWVRCCPPDSSVEESYLKVLDLHCRYGLEFIIALVQGDALLASLRSMVQFKDEEWVHLKRGSNLH